jgi:hypothetical protein
LWGIKRRSKSKWGLKFYEKFLQVIISTDDAWECFASFFNKGMRNLT